MTSLLESVARTKTEEARDRALAMLDGWDGAVRLVGKAEKIARLPLPVPSDLSGVMAKGRASLSTADLFSALATHGRANDGRKALIKLATDTLGEEKQRQEAALANIRAKVEALRIQANKRDQAAAEERNRRHVEADLKKAANSRIPDRMGMGGGCLLTILSWIVLYNSGLIPAEYARKASFGSLFLVFGLPLLLYVVIAYIASAILKSAAEGVRAKAEMAYEQEKAAAESALAAEVAAVLQEEVGPASRLREIEEALLFITRKTRKAKAPLSS